MQWRSASRCWLCLLTVLLGSPASAQDSVSSPPPAVSGAAGAADQRLPWDLAACRQAPEFRWEDAQSPIRSLIYVNEPFHGQPAEVFAFYATPGTLAGDPSRDRQLPAIVLIHGGGGTAFAEWVQLWAQRGYAAIAMDLSGRRPAAPQFDPVTRALQVVRDHRLIERTRLERGGPEQGHVEKFDNVGGDLTDDWQVHAVSAVLRAHSLLRSFPEVDPQKTAVTGISWGGYLTCLAASLDDRFRAAVPVYGCGFLHVGESVQKPLIDRLPDDKRAEWIRLYDPAQWLPRCRVPILFVNGTNDVHYPLDSYSKSYALVPGPRQLRIQVNMPHGHPPGWQPQEIGLFVDHQLLGTPALTQFEPPVLDPGSRSLTAACRAAVPLQQAQLHFTADQGLLSERTWQTVPATVNADQSAITAVVPSDATLWFLSATDQRGAMTSSEIMFAPANP